METLGRFTLVGLYLAAIATAMAFLFTLVGCTAVPVRPTPALAPAGELPCVPVGFVGTPPDKAGLYVCGFVGGVDPAMSCVDWTYFEEQYHGH